MDSFPKIGSLKKKITILVYRMITLSRVICTSKWVVLLIKMSWKQAYIHLKCITNRFSLEKLCELKFYFFVGNSYHLLGHRETCF